MSKYRVTADLLGKKIVKHVEAKDEDDAWFIADGMYNWQLNNGLVEELPTRSELLARIQELETAGRNAQDSLSALIVFIKLHKVEATPIEWDVIDKAIFYKNELAALLNNTPLEKE